MSKSRKIFIACPHDFDELSAFRKYWQLLNYHVYDRKMLGIHASNDPFRLSFSYLFDCDAITLIGDWELCMLCRAYHAVAVANCMDIYYDQT